MSRSSRAWRMTVTTLHGFSCGLPNPATDSTLKAWLTDAHVDVGSIGLFSAVRLPYTLKFLWSPVMDRYVPPFLGRRRGWMIVTQGALGLLLAAIGLARPETHPILFGLLAFAITFAAASQDIVVDAYRRESLPEPELALGTSVYIVGYRIGMIVAGAVALAASSTVPWPFVYAGLGLLTSVGALATLFGPAPEIEAIAPASFRDAVVEPLREFLSRKGALTVLAFVLAYKLGDNLANSLTMNFYLDELKFEKTEISAIAKGVGLLSLVLGGVVGGAITLRIGTNRALWVLGVLQALSVGNFALLAHFGKDHLLLTFAIVTEMLVVGASGSAYAAYLAAQTDRRYTATQYALLTAVMGMSNTVLAMPMGYVEQALGWEGFFLFCMVMALPGLLLLQLVAPWNPPVSDGGDNPLSPPAGKP
jgi:MFS transporter, PAT family, beta-lactamase induction signal transducer AmpG